MNQLSNTNRTANLETTAAGKTNRADRRGDFGEIRRQPAELVPRILKLASGLMLLLAACFLFWPEGTGNQSNSEAELAFTSVNQSKSDIADLENRSNSRSPFASPLTRTRPIEEIRVG
ncbi:MAG: hypothetical protein AAF483_04325, partial [Planctomycetota bacterium]